MKQLLAACLLLGLLSPPVFAETWTFVVAGDGRTDIRHSPDPTGINTPVFTKLMQAIAAAKPRFMLFTGDLVSGEIPPVQDKIADQFKAWKQIVRTAAPNLAVLPVRGNHETYGDKDGRLWLEAFKPMLDAGKVAYFPGEEGFSYSYSAPDHPGVVVIAVDQFIHIHRVNLAELEDALKQAKSNNAAHIFVFAHEMAFTCSNHKDSENMAAFPDERDKFIDLLQRYGCEYFLAGHDHAYDWMAIRHSKWPAGYTLNQIVAGTAGAPFYEDHQYFGDHHGYDLTRLDHKQNTHGYLLVTVDDSPGGKATVKFETVSP